MSNDGPIDALREILVAVLVYTDGRQSFEGWHSWVTRIAANGSLCTGRLPNLQPFLQACLANGVASYIPIFLSYFLN